MTCRESRGLCGRPPLAEEAICVREAQNLSFLTWKKARGPKSEKQRTSGRRWGWWSQWEQPGIRGHVEDLSLWPKNWRKDWQDFNQFSWDQAEIWACLTQSELHFQIFILAKGWAIGERGEMEADTRIPGAKLLCLPGKMSWPAGQCK